MAFHKLITTLVLCAFALANVHPSSCHVLKGSVSCLDCNGHYNLSGIGVLVKCDQVKKLVMTTTKDDGSFTADLPTTTPNSPPTPSSCLAKLVGGPNQLYATRQNMVAKIVETETDNSYTISTPLIFSTTCHGKCGSSKTGTGSAKTINLPLPPEWGLAPSSYYLPFFPIIGIP